MHPGGRGRGDVSTRGIPLDVRETVVLHRGNQPDPVARLFLVKLLRTALSLEVEVPELDVELRVGPERGNENVSTLGRPVHRVRRLLIERFCADVST